MEKPPRWFTPVLVVALLWNLIGLAAIVADALLAQQDLAKLPEAQRLMIESRPGWSVIASFAAVIGGTLGTAALLFRRWIAIPLLSVSLVGLILQDIALFIIVARVVKVGTAPLVMQGLVMLIAIALLFLAFKANTRGWLYKATKPQLQA
jgi:hypothetical protein